MIMKELSRMADNLEKLVIDIRSTAILRSVKNPGAHAHRLQKADICNPHIVETGKG